MNAAGEDGGRRHNFKATGSYDLPYGIAFGFGFRLNSGLPITRTWQIQSCSATVLTNCVRQAAITVNAEPRGSVLLPAVAYARSPRRQADSAFGSDRSSS